MNDHQTLETRDRSDTGALPLRTDDGLLNWDEYLANPPARPSGTIQVRLQRGGRSKPIPVPDPEE
jgi:hypothetical protein